MARLSVAERPAGYPVATEARDVHVAGERPHLTLVSASPSAPPVLREEELVRLWEGQRFPASALTTRRGEALQIVYRGRRSPGAGPDFADAIIADDHGRLLKGDVELHVRASDFRGHGHHHDTRYDNLVLHVVFEDDEGEDTWLLCGRRVAVVALAPWVARRREQLRLWLAQPALWEEPCRGAVSRLGEKEVREMISRLGRLRFHQKQSRFAAALGRAGANQVLYEGLLRALGYSQNAESFAALARLLPYEKLRTALAAADGLVRGEALLLGAAGLLPAGHNPTFSPSPYLRELERRWAAERRRLLGPPLSLCATSGLRPANRPARRLAGAARLLLRRGPSLVGSLRDLMTVGDEGPLRPLVAGWEVPAEGFWSTHYDPGGGPAGPLGALVGRGRALELLINVVLPFAAAWGEARGLTALSRQALALFQRLPRSGSYGAIRFLESSLSGKGGGDAGYQQGLLYLYHQYCTQGGCGACPLSRDER